MTHPLAFPSVEAIAHWLGLRAASPKGHLVAVDGVDGTGKSRCARQLGALMDCPVIECDLFIRDGTKPYPDILDLDCLAKVVASALDRGGPTIIDSVMVRTVCAGLEETIGTHIYVRRSTGNGQLLHGHLFGDVAALETVLAEENELCRAARIPDSSPVLAREIIRYHIANRPQEKADAVLDTRFDTE